MGFIGAEFSVKEATSINEATGDALALKHSIHIHTWKKSKGGFY